MMNTSAYITSDLVSFHSQKASFLTFQNNCLVSLAQVMSKRCLFYYEDSLSITNKPKSIPFMTSKNDTSFPDKKVNLIIADDFNSIYSNISFTWVRSNIALIDVANQAKLVDPMLTVSSWNDYSALSQDVRIQIMGHLVADYAKKKRQNVKDLIDARVITWEQFNSEFTYYENNKNQVVVVPNTPQTNFVLNNYADVYSLIYGEHRRAGEFVFWYADTGFLSKYVKTRGAQKNPVSLTPDFYSLDDVGYLEAKILQDSAGYPNIMAGTPVSPLQSTFPHPLANYFEPQMHVHYQNFTSEQLTEYAKNLNIKGYSGKTKAELILIIGEHISAQNPAPALDTPLLLRTYPHSSLATTRPKHQVSTIEEYYHLAIRTIGKTVYSPVFTPSPAGRLNTTGQFTEYYGYEPLNILRLVESDTNS